MGLIKALIARLMRLDRRIKFVLVGGLNTLIAYGINALLQYAVFGIPPGGRAQLWQIATASALGHAAGMLSGFFLNRYFTFGATGKRFPQFVRFCVVSIGQLLLSVALQKLIQEGLGVSVYAAMLITLVVTTVLGYTAHRLFTFKDSHGIKSDSQ